MDQITFNPSDLFIVFSVFVESQISVYFDQHLQQFLCRLIVALINSRNFHKNTHIHYFYLHFVKIYSKKPHPFLKKVTENIIIFLPNLYLKVKFIVDVFPLCILGSTDSKSHHQ